MTAGVADFLLDAVEAGRFPGAAFAFGTAGADRSGEVGRLGYGAEWPEVDADTRYDLASLTKVVATTPVARQLWANGAFRLDQPVSSVVPGFRHAEVTFEHLLRHESGLSAYLDLGDQPVSRSAVVDAVFGAELEAWPGAGTEYSCVGFVLLQLALETITGRGLDDLARDAVFGPLGMARTGFGPLPNSADVAPTSRAEPWRAAGTGAQGWLQGTVHDPLAFRMGGVSGNAGLFGNAADVATYAQSVLRDREGWSTWTARVPGHERALGWDLKTPGATSAGSLMSVDAFGHTGFTGTVLWIDPAIGMFACLLTNAVHPLGAKTDLRQLRSEFCDLCVRALG